MTTQQKAAIKRLGTFLAVLVPALTWALSSAATTLDTRFVHQASYEKTRILDSLNYRQDVKDIRAMLFHLDSEMHRSRR